MRRPLSVRSTQGGRMKRVLPWAVGTGLLFMAACGDSGGGKGKPDEGDGTIEPAEEREWTFFVYGHADHNLSNSLMRDIAKMAEAKLGDNVHVVVLADFDASQNILDSDERFPEGAHWLRIPGGGAEPETLAEEEELNFDDPKVLEYAVKQAFTYFPARRRALILWDHGGAWNGGFGGDMQNGTASEVARMSAEDLAKAVRGGLREAKIEQPLDIFSFDTCLLAGTEILAEFQGLAQVYIADAEIDYGDGWNYTAFLSHLSAHPSESATALAEKEVATWDELHAKSSSNDTLLRSHVAIDLARYQDFETRYAEFVDALLASDAESGITLGRAAYFTLPPYMNQLENPGETPALRDVGSFLTSLAQASEDPAIKASAEAAQKALDAAILGLSQGTLRDAAGQHGVHIELPLASAISSDHLTAYAALAPQFAKKTGWDDALRVYGLLNDGIEPSITAAIENDIDPDATRLPTVTFGSTDEDVAAALVDVALITDPTAPDELVFFGVVAKGAIEKDLAYSVAWDGQLTALPDGAGGLQAVSVNVWEDLGQDVATGEALAPLLAIFGVVHSGGEEALGALLYQDGDESTGLLAVFDPAITLPLSEVAVDLPGTTFTPVLVSVSISTLQSGVATGTPIALDRPSLALSRAPAAAGVYALLTSVSDVFGNTGLDLQSVVLSSSISQP